MTAQLDLQFNQSTGAPIVTSSEVEWLINQLHGRGWRTAKDIGAKTENQKRSLRAIAEASEGEIISGQKGYKLTREASIEEIDETIWLKRQGDKMRHRWLQIQRVRHGKVRRRRNVMPPG